MDLDGKVALVTRASGGIGAAVARKLHDAERALRPDLSADGAGGAIPHECRHKNRRYRAVF